MSEFFMIFEPGLKHLVEERRRQKMEIKRPGDGAPPFGPVDLDSGVVYLDAPADGDEVAEPGASTGAGADAAEVPRRDPAT